MTGLRWPPVAALMFASRSREVDVPDAPTARQLAYLRTLRRRLGVRGPLPKTKHEATFAIDDLRRRAGPRRDS